MNITQLNLYFYACYISYFFALWTNQCLMFLFDVLTQWCELINKLQSVYVYFPDQPGPVTLHTCVFVPTLCFASIQSVSWSSLGIKT